MGILYDFQFFLNYKVTVPDCILKILVRQEKSKSPNRSLNVPSTYIIRSTFRILEKKFLQDIKNTNLPFYGSLKKSCRP